MKIAMQTKQFTNAPKFSRLQALAVVIQTGTQADIKNALSALMAEPGFQSPAWAANLSKLAQVFETLSPAFKVFALGGNSKLPFVAFSTLPGVTCPGAGECLQFCYSFRAWRYPAAFARMAQNAFLMRFNKQSIYALFSNIAQNRNDGFDFRLYVDGDFASVADVEFWMAALSANPQARAYGYSKSFGALLEFEQVGKFPSNYMLNISGGHNAPAHIVESVKALPITRGEFIAVSIGRKVKSTDHGSPENNRAIRAAVPDVKVFPCPGQCGTCTGAGHACGLPQMKGRVIAIAMH